MRRHAILLSAALAAACVLCAPALAFASDDAGLDDSRAQGVEQQVLHGDAPSLEGVADSLPGAATLDGDSHGQACEEASAGTAEDAETVPSAEQAEALEPDSPQDAITGLDASPEDAPETSGASGLPESADSLADDIPGVPPAETAYAGDGVGTAVSEPVAVQEATSTGTAAAALTVSKPTATKVLPAKSSTTKNAPAKAAAKIAAVKAAKKPAKNTAKKAAKKAPKKASAKTAKKASKKKPAAGWYTVKSRLNKAFAWYLKGLKRANGASIVLAKGAATPGFAFKLEKSGGYYRILVGIATGKSVRVASKLAVTGAKGSGADLFRLKYVKKLKAYRLVNKATGLALAVDGGKASQGAQLSGKKPKAKSKAQAFIFEKRGGILGTGVYAMKPATDTWSALTVDNSKAFWYGYMKDFDQKWHVAPVSGKDNVYTIESISTGKRLAGVKDAQSVLRAASSADKAQQWKASYTAGGIVWKNVGTKAPLSTEAGDADEGCWAMNRAYDDQSTRQFKMVQVPAVESGVYTLRLGADASLGLAVASASKNAGSGVQAAARKDANAQKWYYNASKHTLTNMNSGLVLEAKSTKAGAKIVQRKASGAKRQSWDFEYVGAGKFKVLSLAKKKLVVGVGAAKAGKAAKSAKDKGKATQLWKVSPALVTVKPRGFNLIMDNVNAGHGKLMPDYVCIHETANPGASALAHRNLWSSQSYYADYAVHYTLDWTGDCYYCVPEDRRCWQVGNGNGHVLGIELCHATNPTDFKKVWNAGVQWAAWELRRHHWGIGRLVSHDECRTIWGGTDHTDPVGYFAEYGKNWADFKAAVAKAMK